MLTLRSAAEVLRGAAAVSDLRSVAAILGFGGDGTRLDAHAKSAFGLDAAFEDATLLRGPGALCALLFSSDGDQGRALLNRAANHLIARAPHGLWVLLTVEPGSHRLLIGAATPGRRGARVAALIVDRKRVLDSDADTFRQLAGALSPDDVATHTRFVEILGRDALTRRFFRELASGVSTLAASARVGPMAARNEMALLYVSRLLFLGFLESKGWLDEDPAFLTRAFDECMARGGDFHTQVLLPLFFGTLNTPPARRARRVLAFGKVPFLNGGLFTPTVVERSLRSARFSDEACGRLLGELFARFRFTALEETATFEEAAIDPEMLGRAFESLMAAGSRRASGAYYTPRELVERVTGLGIDERVGPSPTLADLARLRVLDPACGSGAFLVHTLDRLAELRSAAGDVRPSEAIRREVLATSIFGVDVNPTAVWLCQLRLWLSIVVESRSRVDGITPLPNLDRNIRVGDSLAGPDIGDSPPAGGAALRDLRNRYARASGARKSTLARALDREERGLALATARSELDRISRLRRDLLVARRGRDLFGGRYVASREERARSEELRTASIDARRRIRSIRSGGPLPFAFSVHFADVAAEGGFGLVVGNPPWVRPHHLTLRERNTLRAGFVVARSAPWRAGASAAGAAHGFASQVDLAAVFVERSLRLLAPRGILSFLLPAKLWRSLSAGGLRGLVIREGRLVRVDDYCDVPASFDAAVYPGLLIVSRDTAASGDVAVTVLHRSRTAASWCAPAESLSFDATHGAPWLLVPPEARSAFDAMRRAGVPMNESQFGRAVLGVKCGFNDAFLVRALGESDGCTRIIAANGREAEVESAALRPVVRGHEIRGWRAATSDERIVWTHREDGSVIPTLSPLVGRWLAPHRRGLASRADARHAARWWSLFRTEGAGGDQPRVVWADIGRGVRAAVLPAGDPTVPLNTCYGVRSRSMRDALALCALLNSPLISAWLSVIAEPARGGYRRYLGWTMALLPLPRGWDSHAGALASIAESAREGASPDRDRWLDCVLAAYGLRHRQVSPLLAWAAD